MNISIEKLRELALLYFGAKEVDTYLMDDVSNAIYFVHDLIEAEVNATKEKEPYATRFIDRMTEAKTELVSIECEVSDMLDDYRLAHMDAV